MRYFFFLFYILFTFPSWAAISFDTSGKWETTHDYPLECSQNGNLGNSPCSAVSNDNIYWGWGGGLLNGHSTEAVLAANNPSGGGGLGARWWNGDGQNNRTGEVRIDFPGPQTELWIRWYQRYEAGYGWIGGSPQYDNTLHIKTLLPGNAVLLQHAKISDGKGPGFSLTSQATSSAYQAVSMPRTTWNDVFGATSDGQWHEFEIHLKMDTGFVDGVGQMWIDGKKIIDNHSVNWSNGDPTAQQGWTWIEYHANQSEVGNKGRTVCVDYDDMVIYNSTPPNTDTDGTPWIGPLPFDVSCSDGIRNQEENDIDCGGPCAACSSLSTSPSSFMAYVELFSDPFEDNSFADRGWYGNNTPVLSKEKFSSDSSSSLKFTFPVNATIPIWGEAMRRKLPETDSIYISYDIRYSENWVGSKKSHHLNEFYLLTNKNDAPTDLTNTALTVYLAQSNLHPRLTLQDGHNINTSQIRKNLTTVTENRAVAGCNGDSDGHGKDNCSETGTGLFINGKSYTSAAVLSAGKWHRVEAHFKLNTISKGKGVADGVLQYWLDGQKLIDKHDILFRTAQQPDMLFNQFVIAPWLEDGSPIAQAFWIDNLMIGKQDTGDSLITYYLDNDGDGFPSNQTQDAARDPGDSWYNSSELRGLTLDCDDFSNTVHPGAPEILGNGIADDCTGEDQFSITFSRPTLATISGNGINCGSRGMEIECSQTYDRGTTQEYTLQYEPATIAFQGWTGDVVGKNNPLSLIVDKNMNITAGLSSPFSHTVTFLRPALGTIIGNGINCGEQRFDCSATYFYESTQYFLLRHDKETVRFDGWHGDASTRSNPLIVTIDANKIIGATLSEDLSRPFPWNLFLQYMVRGQKSLKTSNSKSNTPGFHKPND